MHDKQGNFLALSHDFSAPTQYQQAESKDGMESEQLPSRAAAASAASSSSSRSNKKRGKSSKFSAASAARSSTAPTASAEVALSQPSDPPGLIDVLNQLDGEDEAATDALIGLFSAVLKFSDERVAAWLNLQSPTTGRTFLQRLYCVLVTRYPLSIRRHAYRLFELIKRMPLADWSLRDKKGQSFLHIVCSQDTYYWTRKEWNPRRMHLVDHHWQINAAEPRLIEKTVSAEETRVCTPKFPTDRHSHLFAPLALCVLLQLAHHPNARHFVSKVVQQLLNTGLDVTQPDSKGQPEARAKKAEPENDARSANLRPHCLCFALALSLVQARFRCCRSLACGTAERFPAICCWSRCSTRGRAWSILTSPIQPPARPSCMRSSLQRLARQQGKWSGRFPVSSHDSR